MDSEIVEQLIQEVAALRTLVERDLRARATHSDEILDLQRAIDRLNGFIDALTFDGQGVIVQEESPPVLRLLAALLDDNRTLQAQLAQVIGQNAILIGDPSAEEVAALAEAQEAGSISLPALLKTIQDNARALREVRLGVRVVALGLALTLGLLVLHAYQMVGGQFLSIVGGP
jgi:hypothetical protein